MRNYTVNCHFFALNLKNLHWAIFFTQTPSVVSVTKMRYVGAFPITLSIYSLGKPFPTKKVFLLARKIPVQRTQCCLQIILHALLQNFDFIYRDLNFSRILKGQKLQTCDWDLFKRTLIWMAINFMYPDVFDIKVDGKRNEKVLKSSGEKFCIWGRPSD